MVARRRRSPANGLDAISVAIGSLETGVDNLVKAFDQHCDDDERRHKENLHAFGGFQTKLDELATTAKALAESVAAMKPDVADYREHRIEKRGIKRVVVGVWTVLIGLAGVVGGFFAASHGSHPAAH